MVYPRDTIAALSTASGPGAVAIVRVGGPDAAAVAAKIFRGTPPDRWEAHRLYAGRFVDRDEQVLDHGLAVIMRAPRSYTGEDVVELHCHGGVLLARRLLGAAFAAGARAAAPGEFTLRAFLNGKMDLAQAESVADLVAAPSEAALRAALGQLEGKLSRVVEQWRGRLVGLAAQLEVAIDFSEEDVGELDRVALSAGAAETMHALRDLAATHAQGRILREGLRVAIVGKPNVGKSSLLNRLLEAERAIVTPLPGTTRDVIEEAIDLDGLRVVLVDTAGLRTSVEEVERIGVERTHAQIDGADLAIVVLDGSRSWEAEDATVLNATRHKARIILINKVDLTIQLVFPESLQGVECLRASALAGVGIDALKAAIARSADLSGDRGGGLTITRERHRQALDAAADSLGQAIAALAAKHPPDVVAVDIMAALDHLGEIVGQTSPEAVLDRIFSEFCIGK